MPPPQRILEDVLARFRSIGTIVLHPDGKRITFPGGTATEGGFWAVPLAGGSAARVNVSPAVQANMKESQLGPMNFRWASAGDAMYIEGAARGVVNLWRVGVDPSTLEWVSGRATDHSDRTRRRGGAIAGRQHAGVRDQSGNRSRLGAALRGRQPPRDRRGPARHSLVPTTCVRSVGGWTLAGVDRRPTGEGDDGAMVAVPGERRGVDDR